MTTLHNDSQEMEYYPPVSSRDPYTERESSSLPSMQDEYEATLSSIILDEPPSTVTHLLLAERGHAMTKELIASRIGKKTFEIEGTLALLESRGWVIRFPENGLEKYIVQAVKKTSTARGK